MWGRQTFCASRNQLDPIYTQVPPPRAFIIFEYADDYSIPTTIYWIKDYIWWRRRIEMNLYLIIPGSVCWPYVQREYSRLTSLSKYVPYLLPKEEQRGCASAPNHNQHPTVNRIEFILEHFVVHHTNFNADNSQQTVCQTALRINYLIWLCLITLLKYVHKPTIHWMTISSIVEIVVTAAAMIYIYIYDSGWKSKLLRLNQFHHTWQSTHRLSSKLCSKRKEIPANFKLKAVDVIRENINMFLFPQHFIIHQVLINGSEI